MLDCRVLAAGFRMLDVAICVVTIGVQVAKDHILAQNLRKNHYYPRPKYPFRVGFRPQGLSFREVFLARVASESKLSESYTLNAKP